jgi:hypothetical protein
MDTPQLPPLLRTEISVDVDARTVKLEFFQDEKSNATIVFNKADTHRLIEGLQKAVNAIGNRKAKAR